MKKFKSFFNEMSRKDLNPKFRGMSPGEINKIAQDKYNRKHSPQEVAAAKKELEMRSQVRESAYAPDQTRKGIKKYAKSVAATKDWHKKHKEKKDAEYAAWVKAGRPKKVSEAKATPAWNKKVDKYEKKGHYERLIKLAKTPEAKKKLQAKLDAMSEETGGGAIAGSPGNNTRSGPGMGDDNSLHMRKMRTFKKIHRRHRLPKEMRKEEKDPRLAAAGVSGYNQPKADAHGDKSHVVVAKEGDKVKTIRFGQKGVKGSPDGSKRNKSFKARHAKNIAKGKMSAAYWADRVKW